MYLRSVSDLTPPIHLQDTTQFDAAWSQESATNQKFLAAHAGGMKQQFDKPGRKKERK